MGLAWIYPEELRPELKEKVDAAKEACKLTPDDIEVKKNLAHALECLATCEGASDAEDMKLLHDAVLVWEEILDINPQDHRAMFEMGLAYYTMVTINYSEWYRKIVDYDAKIDASYKAIDCFKRVGEKAPEIYRDYFVDKNDIMAPDVHEKFGLVKEIKRQIEVYRDIKLKDAATPDISAAPENQVYRGHELTESVQDRVPAKSAPPEFMEDFVMGSEDIQFFMTESVLHPDNAEIWKKWGIALMRLSCQESGNKKRGMVSEAISKLKNALSIYPNDVEVKDLLIESYNQLLSEHCQFEDGSGEAMSSTGNFEVAELKTNIKRRREAW